MDVWLLVFAHLYYVQESELNSLGNKEGLIWTHTLAAHLASRICRIQLLLEVMKLLCIIRVSRSRPDKWRVLEVISLPH